MRAWVFVLVLLMVGFAHPQNSLDSAFDRLVKVEEFAFGPTGFAGTTSQGEKDFQAIIAGSDSLSIFEKLYVQGNAQAKAYALVGIRKLDPARFKQLTSSAVNSNKEVAIERGCVISRESFGKVVKRIAAGEYDKAQDRDTAEPAEK